MSKIASTTRHICFRAFVLATFLITWSLSTQSAFYFRLDHALGGNGDGDAPLFIFIYIFLFSFILWIAAFLISMRYWNWSRTGSVESNFHSQHRVSAADHKLLQADGIIHIASRVCVSLFVTTLLLLGLYVLFSWVTSSAVNSFFNGEGGYTLWVMIRLTLFVSALIAFIFLVIEDIAGVILGRRKKLKITWSRDKREGIWTV